MTSTTARPVAIKIDPTSNEYQVTGLHVTVEEADAWLAKLEAGQDIEPPECHV